MYPKIKMVSPLRNVVSSKLRRDFEFLELERLSKCFIFVLRYFLVVELLCKIAAKNRGVLA